MAAQEAPIISVETLTLDAVQWRAYFMRQCAPFAEALDACIIKHARRLGTPKIDADAVLHAAAEMRVYRNFAP
jgi:hypothetical protein